MRSLIRSPLLACLLLLSSAACGDTTGPENLAEVTLSFVSASSPTTNGAVAPTPGIATTVSVTGSNGTLVIDEVQIVVDEFKLEGDDDSCDGGKAV